jgi:ribosomal protein S18 acetylase RimI-like enzyme
MVMEAIIRAATAGDYATLCALFDEVDALHRDHLPHIFRKPAGPARERACYDGLIADENVGLFLAEVNGSAVGFVHGVIREAPAIPILVPRRYAVIDSIGVKSGFRGRGIGRMLMQHIHAWAITAGAGAIELNVHAFNTGAIEFYRKLGYEVASQRMSRPLD